MRTKKISIPDNDDDVKHTVLKIQHKRKSINLICLNFFFKNINDQIKDIRNKISSLKNFPLLRAIKNAYFTQTTCRFIQINTYTFI